MIIDGHAHACGDYLTVDSIQKKLSLNNIDFVVLVPGELNRSKARNLKEYTIKEPLKDSVIKTNRITKIAITLTQMKRHIPQGNEYVYQLKNSLPDKIKQFFWITKKQWNNIDEQYEKMKFDGIKLHQCWEWFKIDSELFNEITEWATNKDLPLFLHLYSHKEILKLIDFIRSKPKVKLIIGHNFGAVYFINEKLKYFDNIYFDISNTYFVSEERVKLTLNRFGSSKLLLGSDTPYGINSLEKCIDRICKFNITETEKENILGNNMKYLLKINQG